MGGKSALVIVDVQNDFCPGGALPVREGDRVVPLLNKYSSLFMAAGLNIYASRDWHPPKTAHFKAYGGNWPAHCVQYTKGGEFHAGLKLPADAVIITKGDRPDEDSYSCFQGRDPEGRGFAGVLRDAGIDHIFVGGLAIDYCVKATVLDGLREGFRVTVLIDAVKGVDMKEGDSRRAMEEMTENGADAVTLERIRL